MPVGFDVTNQKASPALYASSFATRPAPAFVGRLFVDTDTPSTGIYRDTGTVWLSISGGSSETQSLNDVCVIGNTTTTLGISINGQSTVGTHDSSSSSIPPEADFALTIGEDYPATGFSIYTTHKNHFAGVLRNEGTVVFDTLGGTGSRIVVASADGTLTASSVLSSYVTGNGTTNYVPKFNSASSIGNSQIFDNGTSVAIGTASPFGSAKLQIKTSTDINIAFQNGTLDATGVKINAYNDAASLNIPIELNGSVLYFKTGETEKMRITSGGNVLIGTTTIAGYALDVNGLGNFSGALTGTSASFTGVLTLTNGTTSSNQNATGFSFNRNISSGAIFSATGFAYQWQRTMSTTAASDYLELQLYNPSGAYVSSPFTIYGTGAAIFTSSVNVGNFTTAQKNSLTASAGMIVYDTTLAKLCVYTTAWETITSI